MPRTYKRKNRYCRNTKLSEVEFKQVLTGFLAGSSAAALSRDMNRSEKTVRAMFARLRMRLAEDSELTGWMGGGSLPANDNPVWLVIYDCLMKCPAYIDDRKIASPSLVSKFRGSDPDGDHSQRSLSFIVKKHGTACNTCPIRLDFDFDISVRGHLAQHDLRVGGIPRDNFKPHYFESMLRANIETDNEKFDPIGAEKITAEFFLSRLAKTPL